MLLQNIYGFGKKYNYEIFIIFFYQFRNLGRVIYVFGEILHLKFGNQVKIKVSK